MVAGPRTASTMEVVVQYRFAEFEIDLSQHELRRLGEAVHIEPQVFDLIVHLVRNHDRIVSKDELIETIWNGRIITEAVLSSRINGARCPLGDNGNDQVFIRTFDIQEGMAIQIAATIEPELSKVEQKLVARKAPGSLDAWDCYQRGLWNLWQFTTPGFDSAEAYFQRAIAADP